MKETNSNFPKDDGFEEFQTCSNTTTVVFKKETHVFKDGSNITNISVFSCMLLERGTSMCFDCQLSIHIYLMSLKYISLQVTANNRFIPVYMHELRKGL